MHFLTFYVAFLIKKCDLLSIHFWVSRHKKTTREKVVFFIIKCRKT